MTKQFNIRRLPEITASQIKAIQAETSLTKTQIVIMAIDQLAWRLVPNTADRLEQAKRNEDASK